MARRSWDVGRTVTGACLALVVSAASASVPAATPAPRVPGGVVGTQEAGIQAYKGKLVDESGKPISGIFPMTFKMYAGLKAKKPVWTETMWVAVDRGVYNVHLGAAKPLPPLGDLDKMVLGVDVKGVGELVREPFAAAELRPPVLSAGAPRAALPGAGPTPGRAGAAGSAKYADTAGYAVEADHAKNTDRLMNLTLDEVVRRAAEEAGGGGAGGAAAAGGKVRLGTGKRYGNRVGGPGGTGEYNESCPKGYVMTGIRGGSGNFVDSIQIICSPIE